MLGVDQLPDMADLVQTNNQLNHGLPPGGELFNRTPDLTQYCPRMPDDYAAPSDLLQNHYYQPQQHHQQQAQHAMSDHHGSHQQHSKNGVTVPKYHSQHHQVAPQHHQHQQNQRDFQPQSQHRQVQYEQPGQHQLGQHGSRTEHGYNMLNINGNAINNNDVSISMNENRVSPISNSISNSMNNRANVHDNSNSRSSNGSSDININHNICLNDSNELPPPPPLTPPPVKERFSYTRYQLEVLNGIYEVVRYPNSSQKQLIAKRIGITRDQVKIWFQNRRRKDVVGKGKGGAGVEEQRGSSSMVPENIMKGVVSELLRYTNEQRGQNKKARQKMASSGVHRHKPYARPEKDSGTLSEDSEKISNGNQLNGDGRVLAQPKPSQQQQQYEFQQTHPQRLPQQHQQSQSPVEQLNSPPYCQNSQPAPDTRPPQLQPELRQEPEQRQSSPTSSLNGSTCGPPARSQHLLDIPAGVTGGGSPDGSPTSRSPSAISAGVNATSPHGSVSSPLSVASSGGSPPVTTSRLQPAIKSTSSIPSSEQLDMLAPPNAVAPGAPASPPESDSSADSFDDECGEDHAPKDAVPNHSGERTLVTEAPPNVTLSTSEPLPPLNTETSSVSGLQHGHRPPGGRGGIYAPIPSYPTLPWMNDSMRPSPSWMNDPMRPSPPWISDAARPSPTWMGDSLYSQQPCYPFPLGVPSTPPHYPYPSYKHSVTGADPAASARERLFSVPLVAEPPRRLSTMAPAYTSEDLYHKALPPGVPPAPAPGGTGLYRDAYQPLLISSLTNPYFGVDAAAASWQHQPHEPSGL